MFSLHARTQWHKAISDEIKSGEIIYWMQNSQRIQLNHGLLLAQKYAKETNNPLTVCFAFTPEQASSVQNKWIIQGLAELTVEFERLKIPFTIYFDGFEGLIKKLETATLLVMDKGVMPIEKQQRKAIVERYGTVGKMAIAEVDSNVSVPIEVCSDHMEYGAYTLRPKFWRHFPTFYEESLLESAMIDINGKTAFDNDLVQKRQLVLANWAAQMNNPHSALLEETLKIPYSGGETEALKQLKWFVENGLSHYGDRRDPIKAETHQSKLAPYLHFGQISPLTIAQQIYRIWAQDESRLITPAIEDFLEELLVRRELAYNMVFYSEHSCNQLDELLPNWAIETLKVHEQDAREDYYTLEILENGKTHDPLWNAMQNQLKQTGFLPGYIRMYWGKRFLEWTRTPQEAYTFALEINNRYALDGNNPNSIAGVAWCFGKHDRAFKERGIYGKVRYLSFNQLKKKMDVASYMKQWG